MSQTPMNENERELISASLDNELSAEERAVVAELLKRDDAREYLRQLESARALVASHGVEKAPASVARSVAAATGKSAVVHQLNAVSWRSAVFAVAAALLAAVGVMFGPMLFGPTPISPPEIAREALVQHEAEALAEDSAEAQPADAPAEFADDKARVQMDGRQDPAADAAKPASAAAEVDKGGRVADRGLGGLGGEPMRRSGAPGSQGENERSAESEEARKESGSRDSDEELAGLAHRRARGSAPAPQGRADAAVPHLLLELQTARRLAAQADVLWVAGLHGKAALSPEQEFADILVDLPEAAVEGLRLALQRLAGDQRFGAIAPALEQADETNTRGIDRYLPVHNDKFNDANAADVRVVIRIR
jgi:hypothetical protein